MNVAARMPARKKAGPDPADLLVWYDRHARVLPWRARTGERAEPYRVWLSEIMLQQTTVKAVAPYYARFLARWPTVERLATASLDDVLRAWAGLGYYARARNLHACAKTVVTEHRGHFPDDFARLRALPGIGDYTAAAVASIAFGLPYAVLDGNVLRVVARVENDAADIASARTRERFREMAQSWLDPRHPGLFNQAMMELGATVCLPRNPACLLCPLADRCRARLVGTTAQLPVKLRKTAPVRIEGVLLIVRRGRGGSQQILLRQRESDARRMAGFWDLPSPEDLPGVRPGRAFGEIRHTITHHHYTWTVRAGTSPAPGPSLDSTAFRWFTPAECLGVPLSTSTRKALVLSKLL